MKIKSTIGAPILLIVVFALTAASRLIPAAGLAVSRSPYLAVTVIQLLVFALPSLFWCTLRGKEYRKSLRIRFFSPSAIILVVTASVLLISGSALIGAGMSAAFPEAFAVSSSASYSGIDTAPGVADGLFIVISLAIVPAVTEEVLFRGIMLTEYTSQGVFAAVLISSLAFAMGHFSFVRFPVYLFSGLVLAAVTFATRSLTASVIVHVLNNVFVVFFEDYVIFMAKKQNVSGVLIIFILACAFFISAVISAFEAASLYKSYGKGNADSSYLPEKKKKRSRLTDLSEALFSPTFLLAVVIFIVVSSIV